MTDLSVIIPTFNEGNNIKDCVASVQGWAREIFVVDSYSTDDTVRTALSLPGVMVVQHPFTHSGAQWNWSFTHLPLHGAWTLCLDADERVTPAFRNETDAFLKRIPLGVEGVYLKRDMIFMGRRLRWGGTQNVDLRLFKSGRALYEAREVNSHAVVRGGTVLFKAVVDHYNNSKSLTDWLGKHNLYSSRDAREFIRGYALEKKEPKFWGDAVERTRWLRDLFWKLPGRHLLYFFYRYIVQLGFLDGSPGFRYSFLRSSYFYWVDLKIQEHRQTGEMPVEVPLLRGTPHKRVSRSLLQRLVDKKK